MSSVNSNAFFRPHWLCWAVTGIVPEMVSFKAIYRVYGLIANFLVTICYPTHLALALFRNETLADDIQNLAVCVTCVACSTKFIIYSAKLRKVRELEGILAALDARVATAAERQHFGQIRRNMRYIAYLFLSVYMAVGVTAELSFIFREERSLLYPAWFPFDWRSSTRNFYVANMYQIIGISFHILQNYVDDSFPPMALCLLSGHIKLLGMRVSRIGHHCADMRENERELQRCIVDQKNLYKLFDTIQEIISLPMFIQLAVAAFNICVATSALMFFVSAPLDRLYYFVYVMAMPLQIFPTCYYGSEIQLLFGRLHYDIFCCNWTGQSRLFRKHMILFSERSLKQSTAFAGGMVRIHLDTFFSTCKFAYSLFALIMKMKH